MFKQIAFSCLLVVGLAFRAHAELVGEITKGVEGASPIAVVPFGGPQAGENIGSIVAQDLERSGRFRALPDEEMLEQPTAPEQVRFRTWQALGQEYLVIGQVQETGAGQYAAQFSLFDVVRGNSLLEHRETFDAAGQRQAAHRIADLIYRQIIGEPGIFASRVAFVTTSGEGPDQRKYSLQIADADGYNAQSVISSAEPIMSPAWSPDGARIAYVSFENRTSAVYIQTLATGARSKVSDAPGINGAPAWSPDGRRLALTLSKEGNPDVYVMDLATGSLRRLTDHYGIDTEPNWSPDGQNIVFTSDRGGKPQLYLVSSTGGEAQRVTFEGDYNARGVFSPDGNFLAMVHGAGGSYQIALLDLGKRSLRVLTKGPLDESPGFAPNGRMILYAAKRGGGSQLAAVSIDGAVHQNLTMGGERVRQPAWSP